MYVCQRLPVHEKRAAGACAGKSCNGISVMKKKEIIDIIKNNKKELESRYGVKQLGLFGSYVKGRQRAKSDIDILVAFNRDIDLFEFLDLREYLEDKLRARIDLVMETALKPAIGKRILSEVEYV